MSASWLPRTDLESEFEPLEPNHAPRLRTYPSIPAADEIAYCAECGRQIPASVAIENGGKCTLHASGNVWRDSDDVTAW